MRKRTAFVVAMLCVIALAVGPLIISGPQLYRDTLTKGRWSIAPSSLVVSSSKCTRYMFVASTCAINFTDPGNPNRIQRELNYFVFGSWGGERVSLIRSTDNPAHFSVSIAEEHLLNRQLSLAAWELLMMSLFVACLLGSLRAFRDQHRIEDDIDALPLRGPLGESKRHERNEPKFR